MEWGHQALHLLWLKINHIITFKSPLGLKNVSVATITDRAFIRIIFVQLNAQING